jgi:hypothetical protein
LGHDLLPPHRGQQKPSGQRSLIKIFATLSLTGEPGVELPQVPRIIFHPGNTTHCGCRSQAHTQFCEFSGPDALASCTHDFGDGFYGLLSRRKRGLELCADLCRGPFSDSEVTFLTAASWVDKAPNPHYVKGMAEENLEALSKESQEGDRVNELVERLKETLKNEEAR